MEFVALDIETANTDCSSICQIGIARFEDGCLAEQWSALVNPQDYFDPFNVAIHGISGEMVKNSPTLPDIVGEIRCRMEGGVVLCHTAFDRVAISAACMKYNLQSFECTWLDSARIARRTWPQFAQRGYGLRSVCAAIGYEFRHHDALEDAKASAQILLAAMKETGFDVEGWLRRVEQPISRPSIAQVGDTEGSLHGEVLVFTGALQMMRSDAAKMAAAVGCAVEEGVTRRTTILVVGDQDAVKLAGYEKSSKHRKAEDLARKGQAIEILTEKDFENLVRLSQREAPLPDLRPTAQSNPGLHGAESAVGQIEALRLAWVQVRSPEVTPTTGDAGKYLSFCVGVLLDSGGASELRHLVSGYLYSDDAWRGEFVRLPFMRRFYDALRQAGKLLRSRALELTLQREKGSTRQTLTEAEMDSLLSLAEKFCVIEKVTDDLGVECYLLGTSPVLPFSFSRESFRNSWGR